MNINQINEIAKWNIYRDCCGDFSPTLEVAMLSEERQEFYKDYDVFVTTGEYTLDNLVKMCDAIADYEFVLGGTMAKAARNNLTPHTASSFVSIMEMAKHDLNMMGAQLAEVLPINPSLYNGEYVLSLVIEANNTKSSTKNADGKITKPTDFCPPDEKIREYLIEIGCTDDAISTFCQSLKGN